MNVQTLDISFVITIVGPCLDEPREVEGLAKGYTAECRTILSAVEFKNALQVAIFLQHFYRNHPGFEHVRTGSHRFGKIQKISNLEPNPQFGSEPDTGNARAT
jgi:hypothetical protein